jgi:hypothetical protein
MFTKKSIERLCRPRPITHGKARGLCNIDCPFLAEKVIHKNVRLAYCLYIWAELEWWDGWLCLCERWATESLIEGQQMKLSSRYTKLKEQKDD